MTSNYKRLGDFIQLIKVKNTNGEFEQLLGINIDKFFMPSVANIVGTDLTKYKVVKRNQFACNRMHVGRDYRIPIALSKKNKPFLVSPAYTVFEIINTSVLLPEYLMMWFSRKEFDREAWFHTDADVRGGLPWDLFCDIELPIPSIEKQQEIVKEYNTVVNRIKLNEQLNNKLEETAQALYKHWFVDFEFPYVTSSGVEMPYKSSGGKMVFNKELDKEIPEGWGVDILDNEFDITIGRTPPRLEKEWFSLIEGKKWISIKDFSNNGSYILETFEKLTEKAINEFKIPIIPKNTTILSFKMTVGKVSITSEDMLSNEAIAHLKLIDKTTVSTEYIYCVLKNYSFNKLGTTSSIVNSINSKMIKDISILIPEKGMLDKFNKKILSLLINMKNKEILNINLQRLKDLILSKMTKVEVEEDIIS